MKKITWFVLCSFLLMTTNCAYDVAYRDYATAQANIAASAGPLVTFHPGGGVAAIGNPMVAMAMMNMKEPKDGWTQFFHWLEMATPFGAMFGIVGALANMSKGNTTTVSGGGNFVGNTTGNSATWASPPTTNTTTNTTTNPMTSSNMKNMLPDGLVAE